jgi:hypothetical protein
LLDAETIVMIKKRKYGDGHMVNVSSSIIESDNGELARAGLLLKVHGLTVYKRRVSLLAHGAGDWWPVRRELTSSAATKLGNIRVNLS